MVRHEGRLFNMDVINIEQFEPADGLDFGELLARLGRSWYIVALTTLTSLLIAVIYLDLVKYYFTATMKVAPTQASQQGGLGSKLGRLSSLASVAGVNVASGSGSMDFDLYIEGLQSRDVADLLISDVNLVRRLYPREWDVGAGRWRTPSGGLANAARSLKTLLGLPNYVYQPPNGARLLVLLQRVLSSIAVYAHRLSR